jgi:hypothetical protein
MFNVYWGNWWGRTALAAGQNPYVTKHLIYPVGSNLATFAFSLFLAPLSLPLNAVRYSVIHKDRLQTVPERMRTQIFAHVGSLLGCRLKPEEVVPGEELELTLYWMATNAQPVAEDYTVFVHLVDASGQIIAQHDGEPVAGRIPTSTWREGDTIIDTHRLEWQTQEYTGPVSAKVGLYSLQTLQRLPAYESEGERLPDDCIVLGEISIR